MQLSSYALHGGYVQEDANQNGSVMLYVQHGVYHVRSFDSERRRLSWDSFRTLDAAQKRFAECKRSRQGG